MKSHIGWVFAFVLSAAFLLLLVTFRSIVIPIKAILLNLLSVGAAYGVLVLVFQKGWGQSLLGFESTGAITVWLPLFLFVILFGLSMDYHVFILTRVREAVDRGLGTADAVLPKQLQWLPQIAREGDAGPSALDRAPAGEAREAAVAVGHHRLWDEATLVAETDAALRGPGRRCALATVQLDVEALECELGDQQAEAVAMAATNRLAGTLRPGDGIAPTGRGRLTLLITDLDEPLSAPKVAERVLDRVREPFRIADRQVEARAEVAVVIGVPELAGGELLVATDEALDGDGIAEGLDLAVAGR